MRYETRTKFEVERVMREADKFFGDSGLGLDMTRRGLALGIWEGGGGNVSLTAHLSESGKGTIVELTTTEWDRQVQEFMRKIHGRV